MKSNCDTIQATLSDALDEGREMPPELIDHARHCEDCGSFLALWQDEGDSILHQPMPGAGIELRRKILQLPERSVTPRKSLRWPVLLQSAAALLVVGFCLHYMLGLQPGAPAEKPQSLAERVLQRSIEKEVAALESDLEDGFANLGAPLASFRQTIAYAK